MGQNRFEPTDDQRDLVKRMVLAGVQRDIIAKCVINPNTERPVTQKTLKKHFAEELERGDAQANSEVAAALFRAATGKTSGAQVTAAIFWTKTKMGWRETSRVEIEGDINARAAIEVPGQMTPENWQEVADQYDALGPPPVDMVLDDEDEEDLEG
jgi:hypothetical protein